jgi:hypothetical protein
MRLVDLMKKMEKEFGAIFRNDPHVHVRKHLYYVTVNGIEHICEGSGRTCLMDLFDAVENLYRNLKKEREKLFDDGERFWPHP